MAKRAKVQWRLYLGLSIAAVISFAASSIPFRLAANDQTDTVDSVVTGGIAPIPAIRSITTSPTTPKEPAAAIAPVASVEDLAVEELTEAKGSDDFQAALELIADG